MENRLGRCLRANPGMYKDAASDMCTALELALPARNAPNAVHTNKDFCRALVNGALYNKNVAATARIERDRHDAAAAAAAAAGGCDPGGARARRGRTPSGEWIRKKASGVKVDDVIEAMDVHLGIVLERLKAAGALEGKLNVCIDKTGHRRWDSKPGEELVRGTIRGDRKAYAKVYIIMHSTVAGKRLVLGAFPFSAGDDNYKHIEALIRACQERGIRLGTVMMDREFFDTRVISTVEAAGIPYLVPCRDTDYVLEAKREFLAGKRERVSQAVITRDHNTSAAYTMIIEDKKKIDKKKDRKPEDKIMAFCTNDPGIDVEKYARRWGGESGNRQFKLSRPRTRTTLQGPRVLFFLACLMAYNACAMINALLYRETMVRIENNPPLIELDSVLGILVDAMVGPARGPGPPPAASAA